MFKKFLLCLATLLMVPNPVYAEEEPLIVYVALSEVTMNGSTGTSEQLNALVLYHGSSTGTLRGQLMKGYPPKYPSDMEIHVYNRENIRFIHENCNYTRDPLGCGVKNGHWTLRTFVHVGDKYSTITTKLYDEKGREISKGSKTAWGTISHVPQWKLTRIKEKGGYGGPKETEIFEMYPPKIEELPPLLAPYHIWQATALMYASVRVKN